MARLIVGHTRAPKTGVTPLCKAPANSCDGGFARMVKARRGTRLCRERGFPPTVGTKLPPGSFCRSSLFKANGKHLKPIIAMRDRVGMLFVDEVRAGLVARQFHTSRPREAVRAILSMCTKIAGWYWQSGPEKPEAIAERYVSMRCAPGLSGAKRQA